MYFYIADLHFGHKNIINLDHRPWDDLESMESDLIARWNERVTDNDDVYILGDFCIQNEEDWIRILKALNGNKHIIIGNHDFKNYPDSILELLAEPPQRMMGLVDNGHEVILCHYPILVYRHDKYPEVVMLYGHVHNTIEDEAVRVGIRATKEYLANSTPSYDYQGNLHNVWCGNYNYAPATLQEILSNDQ